MKVVHVDPASVTIPQDSEVAPANEDTIEVESEEENSLVPSTAAAVVEEEEGEEEDTEPTVLPSSVPSSITESQARVASASDLAAGPSPFFIADLNSSDEEEEVEEEEEEEEEVEVEEEKEEEEIEEEESMEIQEESGNEFEDLDLDPLFLPDDGGDNDDDLNPISDIELPNPLYEIPSYEEDIPSSPVVIDLSSPSYELPTEKELAPTAEPAAMSSLRESGIPSPGPGSPTIRSNGPPYRVKAKVDSGRKIRPRSAPNGGTAGGGSTSSTSSPNGNVPPGVSPSRIPRSTPGRKSSDSPTTNSTDAAGNDGKSTSPAATGTTGATTTTGTAPGPRRKLLSNTVVGANREEKELQKRMAGGVDAGAISGTRGKQVSQEYIEKNQHWGQFKQKKGAGDGGGGGPSTRRQTKKS